MTRRNFIHNETYNQKLAFTLKHYIFFEKLGILLRKPLYLITMRYERASFTKLERLRSKNTVDIPQNRYIRTMKGKFKIPQQDWRVGKRKRSTFLILAKFSDHFQNFRNQSFLLSLSITNSKSFKYKCIHSSIIMNTSLHPTKLKQKKHTRVGKDFHKFSYSVFFTSNWLKFWGQWCLHITLPKSCRSHVLTNTM